MQKAFIAGNVTSVKELRDVGSNKVFSFSVAVNNGKDKATGDWKPSSFYDVSMWGARGEAMSRWLTKGTKVAVSGRLQPPRVHEGKAYLSIDADDVTAQGGGDQGGSAAQPDTQANGTARYDDNSGYGAGGRPIDDDIPFAPCM